MCLAHGEEAVTVDAFGKVSCAMCSDRRREMAKHKRRNVHAGRHERETLVRVPNEPLRERFLWLVRRGQTTASDVAMAAGYLTARRDRGGRQEPPMGDIQRLKKRLGLTLSSSRERDPVTGERIKYYADHVDYDTAVRLCQAMGIDYPAEVGV